jgi:hypothetical protein
MFIFALNGLSSIHQSFLKLLLLTLSLWYVCQTETVGKGLGETGYSPK